MLTEQEIAQLDWQKTGGLLPVIVQHAVSGDVLMLGYMNRDAVDKTISEKRVTFYSRTKQRLWTKGESSGHFLNLEDLFKDCDNDTLLALVTPVGPTCHQGTNSCFAPALSLIHISEPTRQAEISYAVFCLKKKKKKNHRP